MIRYRDSANPMRCRGAQIPVAGHGELRRDIICSQSVYIVEARQICYTITSQIEAQGVDMSLSAYGRLPVPRLTPELLSLVKTGEVFSLGVDFQEGNADARARQ